MQMIGEACHDDRKDGDRAFIGTGSFRARGAGIRRGRFETGSRGAGPDRRLPREGGTEDAGTGTLRPPLSRKVRRGRQGVPLLHRRRGGDRPSRRIVRHYPAGAYALRHPYRSVRFRPAEEGIPHPPRRRGETGSMGTHRVGGGERRGRHQLPERSPTATTGGFRETSSSSPTAPGPTPLW